MSAVDAELRLQDLPGIGPRLRERLVEHFGSEEAALNAVFAGDVAELTSVLNERAAITLVQIAWGRRHGVDPQSFLATDEAARIYRMLIERISRHAHSAYARLRIGTLFPTSSDEIIRENREMSSRAIFVAASLLGSGVEDLLDRIKPLRERPPARVSGRAIVTDSEGAFKDLKSRGLDRILDLHIIENPRELQDVAGGYGHVCIVGTLDSACLDGIMEADHADRLDDWYLVPEIILDYYAENLKTIRAALDLAAILKRAGITEFEELEDLSRLVANLEMGEDPEAIRLGELLNRLDGSVASAVEWANHELRRRIEASSVTFGGTELLKALGRGEGIRDLFEQQMRGTFYEVLRAARDRAASDLGLSGRDAVYLDEIFSADVAYPLVVDRMALFRFQVDLRRRREHKLLKAKRQLARELADKKDTVRRMILRLLEFDFIHAIGSFARSEQLVMPDISSVPCLGFRDGRNLFLDSPEPVSYSLGPSGMADRSERVVILSGVNSGGKTTLLDLIAQVCILGQMGLPVPAVEAKISIFEEFYYFAKSRGTLSAGAFETAMRKFSIVENERKKLVLADELESITEPGASARIIASMLDELNHRSSVAVFVSHLAGVVIRFAKTPVRIDGIEAEGLDEENNLVVKRSPRYGLLARSTPELILDRLVRTASGGERAFYERLLQNFR